MADQTGLEAMRPDIERRMRICYPTQVHRKTICITDKWYSSMLKAIYDGENPENLSDLGTEVRREIYDLTVMKLEIFGYVIKTASGALELTESGKEVARLIR